LVEIKAILVAFSLKFHDDEKKKKTLQTIYDNNKLTNKQYMHSYAKRKKKLRFI
jgi:hypothetical protein